MLGFGLIFEVRNSRFTFRALDRIAFPNASAGNTLRGALGDLLRSGPFTLPVPLVDRPSGLADPPRPFVLRAANLDGHSFEPGQKFSFSVNEFAIGNPLTPVFREVLETLRSVGLGPGRARVELLAEETSDELRRIDLSARGFEQHAHIRFVTPTDLKGDAPPGQIPFGLLFGRARDRVSTLSHLYGGRQFALDYAAIGARAAKIQTVHSALSEKYVARRSSRTGQTHGIGGLIGVVEYQGEVGEFLPWLRAASWTGVGRHTVWGNGVIEIDAR